MKCVALAGVLTVAAILLTGCGTSEDSKAQSTASSTVSPEPFGPYATVDRWQDTDLAYMSGRPDVKTIGDLDEATRERYTLGDKDTLKGYHAAVLPDNEGILIIGDALAKMSEEDLEILEERMHYYSELGVKDVRGIGSDTLHFVLYYGGSAEVNIPEYKKNPPTDTEPVSMIGYRSDEAGN